MSAHLVVRVTHFAFVLKLGSKHSHPKEKYKGILKLQESISSDKIKFQTSGKLTHEKQTNKQKTTLRMNRSLCSDATHCSDGLNRSSFLEARCRFFWGVGGRKLPSGESMVLGLQADCFSQQRFYIIESVVNLLGFISLTTLINPQEFLGEASPSQMVECRPLGGELVLGRAS